MTRYSAFIALSTGHYREVDEVIEATDPRAAAQRLIECGTVQLDDEFPIILIVAERAVSLYTRDLLGRAVPPTDYIQRRIGAVRDAPQFRVLPDDEPLHSRNQRAATPLTLPQTTERD